MADFEQAVKHVTGGLFSGVASSGRHLAGPFDCHGSAEEVLAAARTVIEERGYHPWEQFEGVAVPLKGRHDARYDHLHYGPPTLMAIERRDDGRVGVVGAVDLAVNSDNIEYRTAFARRYAFKQATPGSSPLDDAVCRLNDSIRLDADPWRLREPPLDTLWSIIAWQRDEHGRRPDGQPDQQAALRVIDRALEQADTRQPSNDPTNRHIDHGEA